MRATALAAGAATLFVELALVRYVPAEIRVIGYFTNFVLFAAFLGFGTGMLLSSRLDGAPKIAAASPFAFLALLAIASLGRELRVLPSSEEFLFLEYQRPGFEIGLHVFLALAFVVIASSLLPLGVHVGLTLAGDRPVERYGWNLAGSLAGVALFVLLSAIGAPPWLWMGAAGALACVPLTSAGRWLRILGIGAAAAAAALTAWSQAGAIWSPYQKISVAPIRVHPRHGVIQEWRFSRLPPDEQREARILPRNVGFTVRVNDDSYQTPVDLRDEALARHPELLPLRAQYDAAFRVRRRVGEVLIVGAGTGNDVAAALRAGATRVDAVEIDPAILALGAQHPERPYADPRVHVHVNDARSYLANTTRRFDQIVFGLLDSHILLSHGVNVRIDSYVFTREAFDAARARLAPRGILVVSHAVGQPWFVARMRATLAAAFGRPPFQVSQVIPHPLGVIYAAGDPLPEGEPLMPGVEPLEDDWPFLYAEARTIPGEYLRAMLLVILASLVFVRGASGSRWSGISLHFFALGAGFLLIEARGIAVLALLLGSTWIVTSAVLAGVLAMALASTAVVARLQRRSRTIDDRWLFLALALALGVNFAIPVSTFAPLPLVARGVLGSVLIAAPLFASGIVYAQSIAREGAADRAAASNLLGALAGGLVEYVSMITGFRQLVLVAAAFYLLALATRPRTAAALPLPAPAA